MRHAPAGVLQCVHGRALKLDSGMPVQAAPSSAVKSIKCPARLDATGGQRCSFQPQLRNRTVSAQCVAAIGVEITEGPHRHFVTPEGVEVFILGVEHCVKQPHLGVFYRLVALQFKTPSPQSGCRLQQSGHDTCMHNTFLYQAAWPAALAVELRSWG